MGLLGTCVLQSQKYEPEFLEGDSGLMHTYWSYLWMVGCKEMVRNKETLSVNRLVLSVVYYPVFPVYTLRVSSYQ